MEICLTKYVFKVQYATVKFMSRDTCSLINMFKKTQYIPDLWSLDLACQMVEVWIWPIHPVSWIVAVVLQNQLSHDYHHWVCCECFQQNPASLAERLPWQPAHRSQNTYWNTFHHIIAYYYIFDFDINGKCVNAEQGYHLNLVVTVLGLLLIIVVWLIHNWLINQLGLTLFSAQKSLMVQTQPCWHIIKEDDSKSVYNGSKKHLSEPYHCSKNTRCNIASARRRGKSILKNVVESNHTPPNHIALK